MRHATDDTEVRRIPLLDEDECDDVTVRLDGLCGEWERRGDHFFTLGAATYLDVCGEGGSIERYRAIMERTNPVIDDVFGGVLDQIREAIETFVDERCALAPDLARPGFHIFLAGSLDETKRDILHLDLQHRHLPGDADVFSPSLTFTLPIEVPAAGAGIEFCRPAPNDKRGRLVVETYRLGELFIHSGRTLHRRAHMPATTGCRRVTLQGHALCPEEGGPWILYW